MNEREEDHQVAGDDAEREEPLRNPDPGYPADETLPEESEPGQLEDTPSISGDEQVEGQTQHPAPDDDVGVPQDVGD